MLIEQPASPCVSLFLPIEWAEPARQQNSIRLENLLRQAEQRLIARGLSAAAAHDILAPAYELIENRSFWAPQVEGLAIFAATNLFRVYRLPLAFEELVIVDARAHITPLLPLLSSDGQFYVLAVGLGGVQLFQGTQYGLSPVALQGMPTSLRESLRYDEFAKQPQFHPGVPGRSGERGAIFHGQGARDGTVVKQEALRYFQQVDHAVRQALRNASAPLLLAGIAYLLPIYRAANTYPQLIEEDIAVNPDDLPLDELHAQAWAIVAPRFDHARAEQSSTTRCCAERRRHWRQATCEQSFPPPMMGASTPSFWPPASGSGATLIQSAASLQSMRMPARATPSCSTWLRSRRSSTAARSTQSRRSTCLSWRGSPPSCAIDRNFAAKNPPTVEDAKG